MGNFLVRALINAVAIAVTSYFVGGVNVDTAIVPLFIVGAIITLINATIKPIFAFLSFPLTVITLGLFVLVINALMLGLAAWLSGGMLDVNGWWPALIGGLVLAVVNMLLESVFSTGKAVTN